jgi:hypothetical protein
MRITDLWTVLSSTVGHEFESRIRLIGLHFFNHGCVEALGLEAVYLGKRVMFWY